MRARLGDGALYEPRAQPAVGVGPGDEQQLDVELRAIDPSDVRRMVPDDEGADVDIIKHRDAQPAGGAHSSDPLAAAGRARERLGAPLTGLAPRDHPDDRLIEASEQPLGVVGAAESEGGR